MDFVYEVPRLVAVGLLVLIFVYVLVRSASFAYFRSKYEHFRMLRRLNGSKQEDK